MSIKTCVPRQTVAVRARRVPLTHTGRLSGKKRSSTSPSPPLPIPLRHGILFLCVYARQPNISEGRIVRVCALLHVFGVRIQLGIQLFGRFRFTGLSSAATTTAATTTALGFT